MTKTGVLVWLAACAPAAAPVARVTLDAPPVIVVVDAGAPRVKVDPSTAYEKRLDAFFRARGSLPANTSNLCVVFQVNISPRMIIWHVRTDPIAKSGDDGFDDSVRAVLESLVDSRTPLPEPPPEIADTFKGRSVQISQCR